MTADDLPLPAPARPLWLVTLADLSLLLVGFFVLLQADRDLDPKRLAEGLAAGFGVTAAAMPVAGNAIDGFAPGSADLPRDPAALAAWAAAELRDPRVRLTVTGVADNAPGHGDVDPASGSAAVLAADRARATVAALSRAGVPDARIDITTALRPGRRAVIVTLAFAGDPSVASQGKRP
ncbi:MULTISPECIES: flagellar motor protein MotB [Sphingomonas]|uniref:flagellar motor protein MotB n=1 Tax=Sphingomonas TaxID=13687 RepID=UPI001FE3C664|nr:MULTISPECIES: flagellar motor protein MotB [Sphingomonas]